MAAKKPYKITVLILMVMLLVAGVVGTPFWIFKISQHSTVMDWMMWYCFLPLLAMGFIIFLKLLNKKTTSTAKRVGQAFALALVTAGFTIHLIKTIILTTNAWLGPQEKIKITGVIVSFNETSNRHSFERAIVLRSPQLEQDKKLTVKKIYQPGEIVNLELTRGFWGLLYSY